MQPEGYQNTEEMLRVFRRHAIQSIFQMRRMEVNHRKGQKEFEKIAINLKNTWLDQQFTTERTPEKPSTASPSNQMSVTKPSLLLLFVQQDKKLSKELTSSKKTYFLTNFGKIPSRKIRLESKLALKPTVVHIA